MLGVSRRARSHAGVPTASRAAGRRDHATVATRSWYPASSGFEQYSCVQVAPGSLARTYRRTRRCHERAAHLLRQRDSRSRPDTGRRPRVHALRIGWLNDPGALGGDAVRRLGVDLDGLSGAVPDDPSHNGRTHLRPNAILRRADGRTRVNACADGCRPHDTPTEHRCHTAQRRFRLDQTI